MLRFVTEGPDLHSHKRKQSHRACDNCRRRKKRCIHSGVGLDSRTSEHPTIEQGQPTLNPPRDTQNQRVQRPIPSSSNLVGSSSHTHQIDRTQVLPSLSPNVTEFSVYSGSVPNEPSRVNERNPSRFVGDLNPEGIFLAATSPGDVSDPNSGEIGVWLSPDKTGHGQAETPRLPSIRSLISRASGSDFMTSNMPWLLLEKECLRIIPSPADITALTSIYLEEVHPIFPAIDMKAYDAMQPNSHTKVLLSQAICLAASSNPKAKEFLRISSDTPLSSRAFAERISSAISTSLDLKLVTDKLVLIRILTLLSMFNQLSKDSHISADFLSQAVSYAHTVGLHLRAQSPRSDNREVTTLFCCLWALDRLNAAFHGRPVLMHERDIGRDLPSCFQEQADCFRLFLQIVLLLDKVISFYRPTAAPDCTGWESDFPAFEDLLCSSGAMSVPSHLLATVETFYHAIAMLSCRSQSLIEPNRKSPSYVRQNLAAVRVASIAGTEFNGQLSGLPLVPYALSLALRLYYRELRLSKAPIFRNRSRKQLLHTCGILRDLGGFFTSAMAMVEMAEQTVREMDKVASSMVNSQSRASREGTAPLGDQVGTLEPQIVSETIGNIVRSDQENTANLNESRSLNSTEREYRPNPLPMDYDPNAFDLTLFDQMPAGLDIFEYFDPNFDLNAIDAAMGDSIMCSMLP
ncbi:hypothetical protein AJ80_06475 [Polytolypa hystricis UAMH7299]|uniref:Xylanolytic transcriptional activator regulatory domain-containing protein n=1 Tax=Polytolypa hystricis (strain UAMH7299) TaxID=1447883 RepID=A0A2B7XWD7_POLH7|nr:hypothetical protein AJ80_06475 [Polytolypa hystricis UAMH7299]